MTVDRSSVAFAADLYCVEAVKRAAYALMARAAISIDLRAAEIHCDIEPTKGESIEDLIRDFRREVLDQDLRIGIEKQTEPLRNVILGLAFSRVGQGG